MNVVRAGLAALLLVLGLGAAAAATATTGIEAQPAFAQAVGLFRAQHYAAALDRFRSLEARYGDDASLLYNIANTLYRLDRHAEAVRYFSLCAARSSQLRERSLYNLGLSQLRLGDAAAASSTLAPLASRAQDLSLRALAAAAHRIATDRQRLASRLDARLGIGYADHVVALSEAAEFQPDGRSSVFTEALLSAATPAWGSADRHIRLTGSVAALDYQWASSSSVDLLGAGVSARLATDAARVDLDVSGNWLELGHDPYQTYQSAALGLRLANLLPLRLGLQFDLYQERSRLAEGTGGQGWTALMQFPVPWTERWGLDLRHEWNERRAAASSPSRDSLRLLYRGALPRGLRWGSSLAWRHSDYPSAGGRRIDEMLSAEANLKVPLGKELSWLVTLRHERNESTQASSEFRQTQIASGLAYSFSD